MRSTLKLRFVNFKTYESDVRTKFWWQEKNKKYEESREEKVVMRKIKLLCGKTLEGLTRGTVTASVNYTSFPEPRKKVGKVTGCF